MKIRHKQSGVELGGRFIECGEGGPCIPSVSYFMCERYGSRYDVREWELVPEWEDVTKDCEVEDSPVNGVRIFHRGNDVMWGVGYRLRKISCLTGTLALSARDAFIVERKG